MKGINYQINGRNYFVRFNYYNDRVVKCFLDDYDLFTTFVGKAKLNLADGDEYKKEEGENIALDRALEKRKHYIDNLKVQLFVDLDRQEHRDRNSIKEKIAREQVRFRKKEAKRIAWEQQQAEFNKIVEEAMDMLEKDLEELTNETNS